MIQVIHIKMTNITQLYTKHQQQKRTYSKKAVLLECDIVVYLSGSFYVFCTIVDILIL